MWKWKWKRLWKWKWSWNVKWYHLGRELERRDLVFDVEILVGHPLVGQVVVHWYKPQDVAHLWLWTVIANPFKTWIAAPRSDSSRGGCHERSKELLSRLSGGSVDAIYCLVKDDYFPSRLIVNQNIVKQIVNQKFDCIEFWNQGVEVPRRKGDITSHRPRYAHHKVAEIFYFNNLEKGSKIHDMGIWTQWEKQI